MLADLYLCRVPSTLSCGLRAKCSPSLADTSDEPSFTDMQPLHSGSERKSLVASSYPMVLPVDLEREFVVILETLIS